MNFNLVGGAPGIEAGWDFNFDGTHTDSTSYGRKASHTFVAPGTYTIAAEVYDADGNPQVRTATVQVTDVPALVVLPGEDAYSYEGYPADLEAAGWWEGIPPWLNLIDQSTNRPSVSLSSLTWKFGDGTASSGPGQPSISHLYEPGRYVASYTLTDSAGNTGSAVLNVQVDDLPPEVRAGVDLAANTGDAVQFSGTASDYSGIATVQWDFSYDGIQFKADPTATGSLTPTHVFVDPGTYWVALRAVDRKGNDSIDTITVTVGDLAPAGEVVLTPGQTLREGSPVSFSVAGVRDTDPTETPGLWADWEGTGEYAIVPRSQWKNVLIRADGSKSFTFTHTYDDNGLYPAGFSFLDPAGNETVSDVAVNVGGVGPSTTFKLVDPTKTGRLLPGTPVTLSFGTVTDPSGADTEAGFEYHYSLDGGAFAGSDSPDYVLTDLAAGTSHTVRAYVTDQDGDRSETFTETFQVLGDRLVRVAGTGAVHLTWTNPDGATESKAYNPGTTVRFDKQITGLAATLLTPQATYDLSSNFAFDRVDGSNTPAVTLTVNTNTTRNLDAFVGDGHVGQVLVGDSGTVTVSARGDFGGMFGGPNSRIERLQFRNQTGPIVADRANQILASGTIRDISLNAGAREISADKMAGVIRTHQQPDRPVPQITLTYSQGGFSGQIFTGNQHRITETLDPLGRVATRQVGLAADNQYLAYTYGADGKPVSISDRYGPWTFGRDAAGNPVLTGRPPSAPPGASPGDAVSTQAMESLTADEGGFLSRVWGGAVSVATDIGNAAAYTVTSVARGIQIGAQTIQAFAYEQWSRAGETISWAVNQAGQAALYLGDQVVAASQAVAQKFVQQLGELGQTFTTLWTKLEAMVGNNLAAAQSLLTALVNDPVGVATALASSVGKGVQDFFTGLADTLPKEVLKWATGGLSDFPSLNGIDVTSAASVGPWLLEAFHLTWEDIQGILVQKMGAGNIALINQAYTEIEKLLAGGTAQVFDWLAMQKEALTPAQLKDAAIKAAVDYVTNSVVPKVVATVAAKFAVPAAGVLSSVYKTVTWVVDNLQKFQGLGELVGTIAGRMADVVNNRTVTVNIDNTPTQMPAAQALARDVTTFLNGLIPVGLSFGAAQLSIGSLPRDVADKIQQIQALPRARVEAAIGKVVDRAKALFKKPDNEPDNVITTLPPMKVAGVDVKLWVANVNGKAVVMRSAGAAPAAELDLKRDLPAKLNPQLRTNVETALKKLVDDANAAITAMAVATKNAPTKPGVAAKNVSVALKTTTESFRKLAEDLKLEVQSLVDVRATCFFDLACFAAGTPLRTPWGAMNIEDVRAGDIVLSRDENDPHGSVVGKVVEEVFTRLASVWELLIGGRVIGTSGEHPFYAWESGWVAVRELKAGDTLLCEDGVWRCVDGVRDTGEWQTVYNLRVADYHTYFVGTEEWGFSVWSHNAYRVEANRLAYRYHFAGHAQHLVDRAIEYRIQHAPAGGQFLSGGRNVAVIEYRTATGGVDYIVADSDADSSLHSEPIVLTLLHNIGRTPNDIIAFYTERSPCSDCQSILAASNIPECKVFWSYDYNVNRRGIGPAINRTLTDVIEGQ